MQNPVKTRRVVAEDATVACRGPAADSRCLLAGIARLEWAYNRASTAWPTKGAMATTRKNISPRATAAWYNATVACTTKKYLPGVGFLQKESKIKSMSAMNPGILLSCILPVALPKLLRWGRKPAPDEGLERGLPTSLAD